MGDENRPTVVPDVERNSPDPDPPTYSVMECFIRLMFPLFVALNLLKGSIVNEFVGFLYIVSIGISLLCFVFLTPQTAFESSERLCSHQKAIAITLALYIFSEIFLLISSIAKYAFVLVWSGHLIHLYTYSLIFNPIRLMLTIFAVGFVYLVTMIVLCFGDPWFISYFLLSTNVSLCFVLGVRQNGTYPRRAALVVALIYELSNPILLIDVAPTFCKDFVYDLMQFEVNKAVMKFFRTAALFGTAISVVDSNADVL